MIARLLLILLIAVPLFELYLIIKVGRVIGATSTVGAVVLTAVVGAFLVRMAGVSTLRRAQQAADRGEVPAEPLLEGLAILISAVLLLTPGFATDALGFILLIPQVRGGIARSLLAHAFTVHARSGTDADIIEGEFRRTDDDDQPRLD